ncbi:glycosyltransferase [Shewanella aestuarii]|uniref:Glycosyltransferase n=1 Tax=Shewanella aestuarii TaxID=1028752 RepID=A0A6G9QMP1_9GAMM|nr:glycosyltransferase [Shewanella aestuarii]QIR15109.1 glycosyltransferase [Shewanella aestuarii]
MKNKLIIVATHSVNSRGGISAALEGFEQGFEQLNVEFIRVNSHSDGQGKLVTWFSAWWQILLIAISERSNATFWFHCGPWFSMLRKFSFALTARCFGCKTVAHMHSPTLYDYINHSVGRHILKIFFLPFCSAIALTPWWRSQLVNFGFKKPISVCQNPVSKQILQAAEVSMGQQSPKTSNNESIVTILSMARLVTGKGIEDVIKALAFLPEKFVLKIAGEGSLKMQLIEQVKQLGLQDRVDFVGWVDSEKKCTLLEQADIFCLPSRYDSFGVVFIEAMAFNLPVIACDWGPIADVVTPNVGELVEYGHSEKVAELIVQLIKNKQQYWSEGPAKVIANYSPSICAQTVIDALRI